MAIEHKPVEYRSPGDSRHMIPAEVCGTCSDFEEGKLVPVAFCAAADANSKAMYAWLQGLGPRPEWMDD